MKKVRTHLEDRVLPSYTKGEEIFNMVSHIAGGALAIAALVLCVIFAVIHTDAWGVVGAAIYGSTMVVLYAMSSIYHGLKPEMPKKVFQVIDHCTIYFLIAGTYTLTNYRKSGQQDEQEQQADSTKKKDSNSKVSAKSANTDKLTIDTENQNDEKQDQKMEQNKSEEDNQSTEGTDQSGTGSVATSGSGTSYHFTEDNELLWPVDGQVIMNYSMDKTVYFSTLDQFKYNPALIISGAEGDQVIAGAAGIVKSIDVTAQTGTTVNLDLGNGYELLIGQLKEVPLNVGDTVEANTVVGYVSKPTKYYSLEGCNVYYAMKKDGQPVNPTDYMGE